MLKLHPYVVTKTNFGHGTYIYNAKLSETLFIPIDITDFFLKLAEGTHSELLVKAISSSLECSAEDAMAIVDNTLSSMKKSLLLEM